MQLSDAITLQMPRLVAGILASVTACAIFMASPAQADTYAEFVQISCLPQLHTFLIRRFEVSNLPPHGEYLTEQFDTDEATKLKLVKEHSVFDSNYLQEHPYTCDLPELKLVQGYNNTIPHITINVSGIIDHEINSKVSTYSAMVDYVAISYFEKEVVRIPMATSDGTDSVQIHAEGTGLTIKICKTVGFRGGLDTYNLECRENFLARR